MTQEEKKLLLTDLCARLPYGIICKCTYPVNNETTDGEDVLFTNDYEIEDIRRVGAGFAGDTRWYKVTFNGDTYDIDYDDIKVVPYLRSMSSMTEDEKMEYNNIINNIKNTYSVYTEPYNPTSDSIELLDWLNKKMFDYRGLIPMGIALEAPEGMYN